MPREYILAPPPTPSAEILFDFQRSILASASVVLVNVRMDPGIGRYLTAWLWTDTSGAFGTLRIEVDPNDSGVFNIYRDFSIDVLDGIGSEIGPVFVPGRRMRLFYIERAAVATVLTAHAFLHHTPPRTQPFSLGGGAQAQAIAAGATVTLNFYSWGGRILLSGTIDQEFRVQMVKRVWGVDRVLTNKFYAANVDCYDTWVMYGSGRVLITNNGPGAGMLRYYLELGEI